MKKQISLILALLLFAGVLTGFAAASEEPAGIDGWAADSPAMQSIVSFVTESTDENAAGYIPAEDRIAVFDMDGTLYGERFPTYFNDWLFIQRALYDDSYEAPAELRAFAQAWEDKVLRGAAIDDFDAQERALGPQLYEGLTPDEYADVVRRFKTLPVWGFEGMTYGEAYFQPMVSLVRYLCENDYAVYIVSATYRDAVRVMTEGVLDEYIPADRVIGTDLLYVASGDEDGDSMFYELTPEDELVIAGELFIKNQKTNKATVIQQEIGKMPVLAFGNSTGDFSMATYTLQNEKYGGRAYMLLCDDTGRDYGDPEAAAAFKEKCDANGFYTISERDEFTVLYPEGVVMTDADTTDADTTDAPAGEAGKNVYLAGPMFSRAEKDFNLLLAELLEEYGYHVFLPQRDGIEAALLEGLTDEELTRMIFELDEGEVLKADIVVMVCDGRVPDEGACVELGIAYANGKRCYGVKTDPRTVETSLDLNPMIAGCFTRLFENFDGDKLLAELRQYLAENDL